MDTPAQPVEVQPPAVEPEEKVITVLVREVDMEESLQSREEMIPSRVRDYEVAYRNGVRFPPLLVTTRPGKFPGLVSYVVLDGWHRLQALINIQQGEVDVKVIETPTDASPHYLRWLGGKENLKNGAPLKNKDIHELFKAYIKSGQHRTPAGGFKSYREIAAEIALKPHQTIANWMQKDFPSVARVMSKLGESPDNGAKGTGQRLVDMPELSSREIDLFAADLLEEAINAENDRRWMITQKMQAILDRLRQEAPCTEPTF